MKIPFQIRQKWYQGGFKMHNSELVYLKICRGGLQRPPEPPSYMGSLRSPGPPRKTHGPSLAPPVRNT